MGERLKNRKKNDGTQFEPAWFSIMLVKMDKTPVKEINIPYNFIKSSVSENYQVHLEIEASLITEGKYILNIEALWNKCA